MFGKDERGQPRMAGVVIVCLVILVVIPVVGALLASRGVGGPRPEPVTCTWDSYGGDTAYAQCLAAGGQ
jgi:hypothetical protein